MPTIDFLFQEAIDPHHGLATDRHLLHGFQRTGRAAAVLRVATIAEEGVSIGRWHRIPDTPPERRLWRRATGGPAALVGPGMVGFTLLLPHRSALFEGEAQSLAPHLVPSRYVRGLARGLRMLGVEAVHPGRETVTVNRLHLAIVTFDTDASGALLFEGLLAVDRPLELVPAADLSGESDTGVQGEIFAHPRSTSLHAVTGRSFDARTIARAIAQGFAGEHGLEIHPRELTSLEEQAIAAIHARELGDAWLHARPLRPDLRYRAIERVALGLLEIRFNLEQGRFLREVQLSGDFIANAPAIESLERDLRLCPADWGSIAIVVDQIFQRPENFVLGIGKPKTIPDLIVRALPG